MIAMMETWPSEADELVALQEQLARLDRDQPRWIPGKTDETTVAAVFATGPRGRRGAGQAGDPAWVAAVAVRGGAWVARAVVTDRFRAPYRPGLLAMREGPVLERGLSALHVLPDVLLVDASGRDHPRGAGLALHLGWAIGVPSVGVTVRHLVDPAASTPVSLRPGVRPVLVHAAWMTTPEVAVAIVGRLLVVRTPAPLREARRLARTARAAGAT